MECERPARLLELPGTPQPTTVRTPTMRLISAAVRARVACLPALLCGTPLAASPRAAYHATSMSLGTAAALPKSETQVEALLQAMPEADGRDMLIAVLDTGCDLAAAGLQTTSDGRPKYVDFLDCTGGGDIDTSKAVQRNEDGTVTGLSQRKLTLGPWAEGVDEFRVGALRLFALGSMPLSVLRRIKRERKERFSASHQQSVAALQRQLDSLDKASKLDKDERAARKKDLETTLEQLKEAMTKCASAPWPPPPPTRPLPSHSIQRQPHAVTRAVSTTCIQVAKRLPLPDAPDTVLSACSWQVRGRGPTPRRLAVEGAAVARRRRGGRAAGALARWITPSRSPTLAAADEHAPFRAHACRCGARSSRRRARVATWVRSSRWRRTRTSGRWRCSLPSPSEPFGAFPVPSDPF